MTSIVRPSKMKNLLCWLTAIFIFGLLVKYSLKHNDVVSKSWLSRNKHHNRIPSIVHFVVGQGDREEIQHQFAPSSSFSFINYVTFLAARRHLRPKKLFVHYYKEPNTFWWNQMKHDPEICATLMKSRRVEKINKKFVDHHAHRGDIMRLEVLMKYGGIYLDIDVLTLRSFDPLLNLNDVVMANQDDDQNTACNAVILAERNAQFLRRWYDAYQSFNQNCWDCHSVRIPGRLASIYSNEVTVLPTNTFFRPSWNEKSQFFRSNDYDFSLNYASHLWNKVSNRHLKKLTPDLALNADNTFGRMLRQAIDNTTFLKLKQFFVKNSRH